ncbi:PHA-granule associated protein 4 [Cupriavidus sp. L7L]|nr:PHA-granule associated protein 4 [Cupriavidus sp. L7L]
MNVLVVRSKLEALHALGMRASETIELEYETAWRDAVELGRLGLRHGIRVVTRGTDYIVVSSPAALEAGLLAQKTTFRQRNLHCDFSLSLIPPDRLAELERRASMLGDLILPLSMLRAEPHERWK